MASVGAICLGQLSVHEPCVWQDCGSRRCRPPRAGVRLLHVAHVVDQRPGAVQCGRARGSRAATAPRRTTRSTPRSRCTRCRRWPPAAPARPATRWRSRRAAWCCRRSGPGPAPTCRRTAHVGGQVLDHRQVGQRRDLQRPSAPTTLDTCVRQVQRAWPLTVIAHEPHMPTRQAKRYDSVGSRWRCTWVTTSSTVWLSWRGTSYSRSRRRRGRARC
jgi:hypothetical protein